MLERAQTAFDLQQLLVGLIEARREDPRSDMISILANSTLEEENRPLTHGEILSILQQFLVAGHETTTSLTGNGIATLLEHPDQLDRLRGDSSLMVTAVDEFLRYQSSVQLGNRKTTEDVDFGGTLVPAGSYLHTAIGGANRVAYRHKGDK